MESYDEWRVTVYDIIFGYLRFLDGHTTNHPNYIENQIYESYPLKATHQIIKSLRFGELAVNSNSPNFSVVKLWRVSPNFIYTDVFYKFTASFTECFLFLCRFHPLFVYLACTMET